MFLFSLHLFSYVFRSLFLFDFSVELRDGTRHGEIGEYEYRNGQRIFIIRGFFGRLTETVMNKERSVHLKPVQTFINVSFSARLQAHSLCL